MEQFSAFKPQNKRERERERERETLKMLISYPYLRILNLKDNLTTVLLTILCLYQNINDICNSYTPLSGGSGLEHPIFVPGTFVYYTNTTDGNIVMRSSQKCQDCVEEFLDSTPYTSQYLLCHMVLALTPRLERFKHPNIIYQHFTSGPEIPPPEKSTTPLCHP